MVERHDAAELITLDRPGKSNSLHPDLIARLTETLREAEKHPTVRVLVLTGAGRSFCAGLDLRHLAQLDEDEAVQYMRSAFALFRQVHALRQPVIAAVNGPAIAGGFDLAAFCDIRLCSSAARFAQTEILLGLTQIMHPIYKAIGLARAVELALTGKAIDAAEAYRIGLVSGVHQPEDLLPEAMELAQALAARPPEALYATKRLGREVIEMDNEAAMTRMLDVITTRLRSDEHRQALDAYVSGLGREKRL